ncbi:CAP domain-containing protein [Paracoccus suum]|uniref:CAP domain-containing protein n=2 Tax=Paracoccus suum TaxID=2259340 RepID=A0A344PP87_9RHOB|nr:CAP domain-containing protein [Paracoccus suum]
MALQATNAVRTSRGLAPLRPQPQVQAIADAHACEMARRGTMTHRGGRSSGPGARLRANGYNSRVAAENIAAGRFTLPQVLAEWSRSGGHMANIMRPDVRDFALGRAIGADGKTSFWAAVYAGR